jgi:hypothetical protein
LRQCRSIRLEARFKAPLCHVLVDVAKPKAKERDDKHHMKHLIMSLNAFTEEYKQRNINKSKNKKKEDAKFLMEMSDRHRALGDNEKALMYLEQSMTAFDMSFADPTPTEMEEAEDTVVDHLLKHNGDGGLGNVLEEPGANAGSTSDDSSDQKRAAV